MITQEVVVLSSSKVHLRKFREGEADLLYRITSDPEVMKFLGGVKSLEDTARFLTDILSTYPRRYGLWAIIDRATMEFAGYAGLCMENSQIPELKIAIVRRFWRQGLAKESVKLCINYAARHLQTSTVEALLMPDNKPAKKVMRKAGFKFKKNIFIKGKSLEQYTYTPNYLLN